MTIQDAYTYYLDLVEKNSTNNNLNVDRSRFISNYNFISIRFQEWILNKRNEDAIRDLAPLLIVNKPLLELNLSSTEEYTSYQIPEDYFDFANLSVKAKNEKCSKQKLQVWEAKMENVEELLADSYNKPSFKYRETFYVLSEDAVKIFKDNTFSITSADMSYYRSVGKVDIEGYLHPDKTPSVNINPDLEDKAVTKILMLMSIFFSASQGDQAKYQLNMNTLFSLI